MNTTPQTESVPSKLQESPTQPPENDLREGRPSARASAGKAGHPRRIEWVRYGGEMVKLSKRLQSLATVRIAGAIHEIEADAKQSLEGLGTRAESELRGFLSHAQPSTRNRWVYLGSELVTLGKRIQSLASTPSAGADEQMSERTVASAKN